MAAAAANVWGMSDFVVWEDIPVRFRDTDAMGHVNNAVLLTYLEVARQAYWKRFSQRSDYARVPFILARVCIDFRSQLRVDEIVRVQLRTIWISRRSFGMRYELRERDAARLVAEAESVQVTYDYERQQVVEVPAWLRRELETVEGKPLPPKENAAGGSR